MPIRLAVAGVTGRMGQALVRAARAAGDLEVAAGVARHQVGEDAGLAAGVGPIGVRVAARLAPELERTRPDVLVELSTAEAAPEHVEAALTRGIPAVVGTTAIPEDVLARLEAMARERRLGLVVAPNFALGAVLMMRFAAEAARYLPDVEIIELHHAGKLDAPSGTALETARRIQAGRDAARAEAAAAGGAEVPAAPARGAWVEGVPIHSVRLPGLVAHQEVIFGTEGQTLRIRHDATGREAFMPGLLLAIRRVRELDGPVRGLEPILFA
ncbi:4-hydroxy-tetrahydrodipicolinate reductase [Limnochorda pilosa]|uniref:4-hydroxy-tetrahydrodipicolinate reductase n=1 Tax=Limnochorda pilosa TaxID=1555112 RepID=A0A0K2SNI3_LIMPI|nr:4-hydroxy-tetrahydrodipicolinate reductase [Limnochorda pilosa]BAS28399.1 dihydrodipicolinate reductase [Limnochorda pilosa]